MKSVNAIPKHILVVRPDAIGDVVLMTPLLNTLKNHYPKAKISVLIKKSFTLLLENHPSCDQVVPDWLSYKKSHNTNNPWSYVTYLRSLDIEWVLFPYTDGFYAWVSAMAGIPVASVDLPIKITS